MVVQQKCSKFLKGGYNLTNELTEEVTYKQFKDFCKTFEKKRDLDKKSMEEIEDIFWKTISKKRAYSLDNELSLFPDDVLVWNLNQFTQVQSNIHTTPCRKKVRICLCFRSRKNPHIVIQNHCAS